jgi:hypothetical protein
MIFMFRDIFALEKVDGTSSNVHWKNDAGITFFPGGVSGTIFEALFDKEALRAKFIEMGRPEVIIYGEAYGGSCQKMSKVYGPAIKFVAFEVEIDGVRLSVPDAEQVVKSLGLEFVSYILLENFTVEMLDAEMKKDSVQAIRNGMGTGHLREGIVLRPLIELKMNNGDYLKAKHKNPEFQETATPRKIDADKVQLIADAEKASIEFVTEMRLNHVLDKIPGADITKTGAVIKAMIEDVYREAAGEIVESRELSSAISKRTALMFKQRLNQL